MHLERDILRGKHFKKGELKKEAREEMEEERGKHHKSPKSRALERAKHK